jgi:hypothetical protein
MVVRERATRLAVEARRDAGSAGGVIRRIADQPGVHTETLKDLGERPQAKELIPPRTQDVAVAAFQLAKAIRLAVAGEHGIRLAISNPCFELWPIPHFGDQHAFLATDDAERKSAY